MESRCLLSVTPADLTAVLVNQTFGSEQVTTTAQSVASDDSGDFVVTWTRATDVLNSNGTPVINLATGTPVQVNNVYARYFTDTVEQIDLPGPGTKNNNGQSLLNGIATNFDNNPNTIGHFSLTYNDETIDQLSVTAGIPPELSASETTTSGVIGVSLSAPLISGQFTLWFDANGNGTVDPGETLTVNYDEATPQLAAAQIQTWLRGIAPVAGNSATGFAGSDATHATVNAIDPHTYVVDFGAATDGLDQSSLLEYLSPSAPTLVSDPQVVTFAPTGTPPVNGTFQLKVGTAETAPIVFNSSNLAATALNIQNALVADGFPNALVSVVPTAPLYTFNISFGQPEPAVQYIAAAVPMPVTFTNNSAGNFNLTGFLPAVQVTNLDRPFTVNDIPVSQTDPNLTAEAIENYFDDSSAPYSTGQAPFDFPPTDRIGPTTIEAPYLAPVYSQVSAISSNGTTNFAPVTGVNPSISVVPVVNPDGSLSYTEFDVTFTSVAGAQTHAPMVVTNCTDEDGVGIGTNSTELLDGAVTLPVGSTEADVSILKQSGNEFQVNPPQSTSIYSGTNQALNSDQPSVAMGGSGNFEIAWRGQISQEFAPKDVTDIYFRMYEPLGVISSYSPGTYVPGTVISDLVTPGEETTDPAEYAAQSFTGVRLLPNPTVAEVQEISFGASITGQFYLQLGSVLTAAINFDNTNLTNTASNIQTALVSAGFSGATVTVVPPSVPTTTPTTFTFKVTFGGASTGVDEPPIEYVPAAGATPVTFTQTDITTDPYTITANANYTNPQFNPSVAVDLYGNFAVVWANQGMDASYFNNVSLQRYDKLGNSIGSQVMVNIDYTNIDFSPDIAIGADGNMVVTWSETADPSYLTQEPFLSTVYVRGFNPEAVPLWNQVDVAGGAYSTVAVDGQDNFTVAWELGNQNNDIAGEPNSDVYAAEYQLENYANGVPLAAPAVLRNIFRVSSSAIAALPSPAPPLYGTFPQTTWSFEQSAAEVQMGLNGDISVTYEGYGPAASGSVIDIPASFFTALIPNNPNLPNGDLLPYFDPYPHKVDGFTEPGDTLGEGTFSELYQENWDVDSSIDQVLFNAEYPGTIGSTVTPATQEQLGRLRAILEDVAGMLRGDSNAVMLSQWDANAENTQNATYSDNIVNTQRDGQDQRYYLVIPEDVQQGSFQLRIWVDGSTTAPADIDGYLPPGYLTTPVINMPDAVATAPGGYINIGQTETNIANAINATLGVNWQLYGVPYSGSVAVREVTPDEIDARNGTEWQIPADVIAAEAPTVPIPAPYTAALPHDAVIFELDFQGQAHDIPLTLAVVNPNDQQYLVNPSTQQQQASFTLGGASPPVVELGDYSGIQGSAQYNAALTMNSSGNMVAVYTDQALLTDELTTPTDAYGNPAYSNVYAEPLSESTDTAGPRVVGFTSANGVDLLPRLGTNNNNSMATGANAQYLVLTFDEPMLSDNPLTDPDSVYDSANYQIYDSDGTLLSNDITHIDYGLSEVARMAGTYGNGMNPIPDNKWEVILTINDGTTPLPNGTYTLDVLNAVPASSTTAGQPGLRNIYGTPLNLTGYNPTGEDFQTTVTLSSSTNQGQVPAPPGLAVVDQPINAVRGGRQIDPAVATANDLSVKTPAVNGNYVVVWTSIINGATNIVGEMFQANGTQIGAQFTANTSPSTSWGSPDVAMDAAGGFVVVWSGAGPNANAQTDPSDIFARRYNALGQPIGNEFQVDQYTATVLNQAGVQSQPSIAMAPDGTFVVTWTSSPISVSNTNTANSSIYAREYTSSAAPINEFQVSNASSNAQTLSDVAMDANDDFVVVWEGDFQSSTTWGVYGDYFTANTTTTPITWSQSGQMLLNNSPNTRGSFVGATAIDLKDTGPRVGMDPAGNFDVTWASFTNTFSGYDVYAQQFARGGKPVAGQFLVNQTTAAWQLMPAIGVDNNGNFTIVYTTYGQDNADVGNPTVQDYGIYTRMYNANGTPLAIAPNEFRVNATTLGNQVAPAVSSQDPSDDSIIVWVGPDTAAVGTTAIYLRNIDPPATGLAVPVTSANPSISVADAPEKMGGSAGQIDFAVSLSAASTKPVTVSYYTSDGTGKAGSNYSSVSGTLVFAPGQTTRTVSVDVTGMPVGGLPNETFLLNLKSPANGSLGRSSGTATLIDTLPAPAPKISVSDVTVQVGAQGTQAVFTVTLSNAYSKPVSVIYGTADGTATKANGAYTPTSGSLTFAPGQVSQTISVPVAGMAVPGLPSETFILNLANAVNGTIIRSPATATLVDAVLPTFKLSGPASGSFKAGQTISIQWTDANVPSGSTVSLAYDTTTNWGNPKWIEVGKVSAANGSGSYSWNTTGLTAGTYYIAGYLYTTPSAAAVFSHLTTSFTVTAAAPPAPPPTFKLSGPASGSYSVGQTVSIQWTDTNVPSGSTISLAYDTTTNWGNAKWIEVGKVSAANGSGSYSWNTTGLAAGTYYIAGYLYTTPSSSAVFSHLTTSFTVTTAKGVVKTAAATALTAAAATEETTISLSPQTSSITAQNTETATTTASVASTPTAATITISPTSGSSSTPVQASTVSGAVATRLSGSASPASASSSNNSVLTILDPAAVGVVLARRLV
ncbi:MAG: Calx-beta domain-containing protein [Thermoguttaceae bacterium]